MTLPISVFIVSMNEEHNIKRALNSVAEFDEVILVDSGSQDNTVNIANEMGATIYHQDWLGYSKQKQFAMSLCKHDWVLNIDADEELPEKLIEEIKEITSQSDINSVRFRRNDYFLNKPYPSTLRLPSNIRLYRKSQAYFDDTCLVHESAKVKGKEVCLKTPFIHYGYNDIEPLVGKFNHYSSLRALEKFQKGKKHSLIKLLLIFPVEFLRKLIFQRYITFGWRGFILALLNAHYAFLKEAKLMALHYSEKDKL